MGREKRGGGEWRRGRRGGVGRERGGVKGRGMGERCGGRVEWGEKEGQERGMEVRGEEAGERDKEVTQLHIKTGLATDPISSCNWITLRVHGLQYCTIQS